MHQVTLLQVISRHARASLCARHSSLTPRVAQVVRACAMILSIAGASTSASATQDSTTTFRPRGIAFDSLADSSKFKDGKIGEVLEEGLSSSGMIAVNSIPVS